MNHRRPTDGDPSDDISYEDFDDDFVWQDPDDDLDVIDLDALDDEIDADTPDESGEADADEQTDAEAEDSETGALKLPPPSASRLGAPRASTPRKPRPVSTPRPPLRDSKRKSLVTEPEPDESGESEEPAPDTVAPEPDVAEASAQISDETVQKVAEDADTEATAEPAADVDEQVIESEQAEEPVEAPGEEEEPSEQPDTDATKTTSTQPPAPVVPQAAQAAPETVTAPDTPAETAVKLSEEPTPEAAPAITAEDTGAEAEPEPPPPDWIYHVLIALPDELAAQVLELRAAGEVNDMPPPGIALAGSFRTEHLLDVQSQLARWTRNHLPLQIEITGVLAEVVGQQQYVAAWLLQPEEDLHEAQHALRRALAPMIQPLPDTRMAFHVHLTISDHVPPRRYPHLIGRMQRDFEPYVWHATDLILVRKDADADDGTWEIANRYD